MYSARIAGLIIVSVESSLIDHETHRFAGIWRIDFNTLGSSWICDVVAGADFARSRRVRDQIKAVVAVLNTVETHS